MEAEVCSDEEAANISSGLAPLQKGSLYQSYEDFKCALEKYMVETSSVYTHYSGILAATHNSLETKNGFKVPEKLKYKTLVETCKHFGSKKKNKNLTGQRPNQKSFKMGCVSKIRLSATRDGFLEVAAFNETHINHPQDPELFPMYPERRQLDAAERAKVEEMLGAKAKPMLVQATLSKFTTPQDIANIRTRLRLNEEKKYDSETQHLFAVLEEVNQTPGSVVIIGEEATDAESSDDEQEQDKIRKILFVFFQTAEMARNFREYPEVVGMDTTYCVNRNNMPLVVFRVTDRHGHGKPAGYCLVSNEKLDIMREAVMAFKEANSASIEQVQTIVVDKDYNEITVLKEVLPWVHIHLCSVHVIDAFKRNSKEEPSRDKVREILQNMVYALTRTRYREYLTELESEASEIFMKYFNDNWAQYGAAWSCYERLNSLNLGQRTNNSVESHNQKIKTLVNKRSTLAELVKGLLMLQVSGDAVTNYKDFLGIMKVSYRTDSNDPTVQKILDSATPFAAECIRVEYLEGLRRVKLPEAINFKNWRPSLDKCPCPIYRERLLPCRHIFSLRQMKGVDVFCPEQDVPARWQKVTGEVFRERAEEPPTSYIPEGFISTEVLKTGGKTLNQNQRFKEASDLALDCARLIALNGGKQYTNKMKSLDRMINIWRKGKDVVVLEAGETENGHLVINISEHNEGAVTTELDHSVTGDVDHESANSINIPGVDESHTENEHHHPNTGVVHQGSAVSVFIPGTDEHDTGNEHNLFNTGSDQSDIHQEPSITRHIPGINVYDSNDDSDSEENELHMATASTIKKTINPRESLPNSSLVHNRGEVRPKILHQSSPQFLRQVLGGLQNSKYKPLSQEQASKLVVPTGIKMRGRPKGPRVLTKIGLKKKSREKVACDVCHELGWWKNSQVKLGDDVEEMCLCAVCKAGYQRDLVHNEDEDIEEFESEDDDSFDNISGCSTKSTEGAQVEDMQDIDGLPEIICISSDDEGESVTTSLVTEVKNEIDVDSELTEQPLNTGAILGYVPQCKCGKPTIRSKCRKLGPNFGRDMFRCPDQCPQKIFRWADTLYNVGGPSETSTKTLPKTPSKSVPKTPSKSVPKTPSKAVCKTPSKSVSKTPSKTVSKTPAKNVYSKSASQKPPKSPHSGSNDFVLCSCGVPAVKRKVYFGEHIGKTISICGKDPVICKFKMYSENPAAASRLIVLPRSTENVTIRRKIGVDEQPEGGKRPKRDVALPTRLRTSYTFDTP